MEGTKKICLQDEGSKNSVMLKMLQKETNSCEADRVPSVPKEQPETNCLWTLHGLPPPDSKQSVEARQQEFFLFMSERQRIFVRRQRGDAIWSASPAFQDFSWCNVYREFDRGTQYFRAHVLSLPKAEDSHARLKAVFFASFVYRQVNRIESLKETGIPEPTENSVDAFLKKVTKFEKSKKTFFTGAHQTTSFTKFAKNVRDALKDLDAIVDSIASANDNKSLCKILMSVNGVGEFYAWQILCDLKESKCIHFDDDMFCKLGPGAKGRLISR